MCVGKVRSFIWGLIGFIIVFCLLNVCFCLICKQDKDKPRTWTLWKSSNDFKKGLAQNGSQEIEVIISKKENDEEYSQEERAAIRIQTAFRGFLVRFIISPLT